MKKYKLKNLLEFCCPALILSYFLIHNIILVLIGILFSIYLINITNIQKFISSIKIKLDKESVTRESKIFDDAICSIPTEIDLYNKDLNHKLVDIIEEEGIIPSLKKNEDINAA